MSYKVAYHKGLLHNGMRIADYAVLQREHVIVLTL